ncbi:MFS transporter [Tersicoccus sp. Bi-70]|uniref:MFS transporter n=1 Tax=Tersicoccus sp. Bi-70 TaxID=1897634 RepID=UPI000977A164|nr:MFS transporter [Tersicoccus sp. Bi-70]OMH31192.1 hypothetical protein BGP79_09050 [Tersicoccus sp. Bi-70]
MDDVAGDGVVREPAVPGAALPGTAATGASAAVRAAPYLMFNFSRKIAQSIAGGLAGFGLTLVGYVPNVAQSAGAALGIKGIQALYPAIAFCIAGLVLWFLYPLTDTRHRELVEEIHVREAEATAG